MKVINEAVDYLIEHDVILQSYVGRDENNDHKVYPMVAPQGTEPPWVVWQIIPGGSSEGHYGDLSAFEYPDVQFRAWGRNRNEAWDLFTAFDNTLINDPDIDIELTPYKQINIRRLSAPGEDYEMETHLFSVQATYRFAVAR
jgi:hypothetical protein